MVVSGSFFGVSDLSILVGLNFPLWEVWGAEMVV